MKMLLPLAFTQCRTLVTLCHIAASTPKEAACKTKDALTTHRDKKRTAPGLTKAKSRETDAQTPTILRDV